MESTRLVNKKLHLIVSQFRVIPNLRIGHPEGKEQKVLS